MKRVLIGLFILSLVGCTKPLDNPSKEKTPEVVIPSMTSSDRELEYIGTYRGFDLYIVFTGNGYLSFQFPTEIKVEETSDSLFSKIDETDIKAVQKRAKELKDESLKMFVEYSRLEKILLGESDE